MSTNVRILLVWPMSPSFRQTRADKVPTNYNAYWSPHSPHAAAITSYSLEGFMDASFLECQWLFRGISVRDCPGESFFQMARSLMIKALQAGALKAHLHRSQDYCRRTHPKQNSKISSRARTTALATKNVRTICTLPWEQISCICRELVSGLYTHRTAAEQGLLTTF